MQTTTLLLKTCLISAFLLFLAPRIYGQNVLKTDPNLGFSTHKSQLINVKTDTQTSYRGISSFADSLVWLVGSNGILARSTDFGQTFRLDTLPGASMLSLRAVHIFNAKTAVVMSSGFESRIFKTTDGGASWKTVFSRSDSAIFLDAIVFCNDTLGYCLGDPVGGKFLLLKTTDGGTSWQFDTAHAPEAMPNEAVFAASNSSFKQLPNGTLIFATGGSVARLISSDNYGQSWQSQNTTILHGQTSQGIFSFDVYKNRFVAVGGDYRQPNKTTKTSASGKMGQKKLKVHSQLPYQSAVLFYAKKCVMSTGPAGTFISTNAGKSWKLAAAQGFNCLALSANGQYIFTGGNGGEIAVFKKVPSTK